MKTHILLLLILTCFLTNCFGQEKRVVQSKKQETRFKEHVKILDSAARLTGKDTVHCCNESIQFMETNTKIYATAYITYYGRFSFTKRDLARWHEWFEKR